MIRRANILSAIIAVFVLFSGYGASALAQEKHKRLNKDNITNFINATSDITSGTNIDFSPEDVTRYLERHLYKRARFKSTMKYNIPGHPSQETAMSLDKKEFIKSIREGAQSLSDYENEITIKAIKISKDGTKATVQTESYEVGVIPISADGVTTQNVPVEGSSNCNQVISLSKKGIIQMYSAQCTTVINFQAY